MDGVGTGETWIDHRGPGRRRLGCPAVLTKRAAQPLETGNPNRGFKHGRRCAWRAPLDTQFKRRFQKNCTVLHSAGRHYDSDAEAKKPTP